MTTICVWCRREGRTSADPDDPAVIAGLCQDHISRFTAEVDAALRDQAHGSGPAPLPATDRLHRSNRRVRDALLQQVRDVLARNSRTDLCDVCVAAEIGVRPTEVEAAAARLAASSDFLRDEWRCGRCGGRRIVTRARTVSARASSATPSTAA